MGTERLIRVTHRDREDTVEGLRAAYTAGCLDDDELEERTSRAYAAKTRGELADLESDLPQAPPSEVAATLTPRPGHSGWSAGGRRCLGAAGLLIVASVGAWIIAAAVGGAVAVPLIFAWLVVLRLRGPRRRGH